MDIEKIVLTQHVKERYAERIMKKEENHDIKTFISTHETKIFEDIKKMIEYGSLIYTGKSKTLSRNAIDVFVNGLWIVLVDTKTSRVITLYKIDLQCGDDFNHEYLRLMMEKLDIAKMEKQQILHDVEEKSTEYLKIIKENEAKIVEFKSIIKELEEQNKGYNTIIDNIRVENSLADKKIRDIVSTLIGKNEF